MGVRVPTRGHPARRTPIRFARSRRQAAATAALLDGIVDRDLALVRAMPVHQRARHVEKLAVLVMLAQAYRHYATGWIGRRELRRRSRAAFDQLTAFIVDC